MATSRSNTLSKKITDAVATLRARADAWNEGKDPARVASGKKAAATRKRAANARSRAAKKAAETRAKKR